MESRFATTSWTQVLAARESPSTESRRALDVLCRTYWYPVYALIRRQVGSAADAGDLTQTYFTELLENSYLDDYDPARGRFRIFLKTSVKHFLSKQREKSASWKRGGRTDIFSLDTRDGEGRYLYEPADRLTPEEIFERRWTLTILERVLARLKARHVEIGSGEQFTALEGYLTGRDGGTPYHETAVRLNTSEAAVKTAVHRLRREFGQLLREEIAQTVAGPEQVDAELRHLLGVVSPWRRPPPD
jgi:RNA polymerase sigma-70 factor (ECF subfamily)